MMIYTTTFDSVHRLRGRVNIAEFASYMVEEGRETHSREEQEKKEINSTHSHTHHLNAIVASMIMCGEKCETSSTSDNCKIYISVCIYVAGVALCGENETQAKNKERISHIFLPDSTFYFVVHSPLFVFPFCCFDSSIAVAACVPCYAMLLFHLLVLHGD